MASSSTEPQIKRQEISTGIFIEKFQEKKGDIAYYVINAEVKIYQNLELTIDFTGSQNVTLLDSKDMLKMVNVNPFDKIEVARLVLNKKWNMKTRFKFEINLPSLEKQGEKLKSHFQYMETIIKKCTEFNRIELWRMKTEEIITLITKFKIVYADSVFQPNDRSLVQRGDKVEEKYESLVQWRKGKEATLIPVENPELSPLFESEPSSEHVRNGKLNDGAVVSALSCLAEYSKLVHRLFLTKKPNDAGVYSLKICYNGMWRQLVLDDFFPCLPFGTYMFSKSEKNELWVPLLEKLFAKKYEGYFQLVNTNFVDALTDLTGCPVFKTQFDLMNIHKQDYAESIYKNLKDWKNKKYVIGAELNPSLHQNDDNSAPQNFTYSIIRVIEVDHSKYPVQGKSAKEASKLINIRNLWGLFQWEGKWSHNSELWTDDIRSDFEIESTDNGLSIWMSIDDFLSSFQSLYVCKTQRWHELRIKGKFVNGIDQNNPKIHHFCSRWFYLIEVPEATNVIFGLHQEDERIPSVKRSRPFIDIGLSVIKIEGDKLTLVDYHDTDFIRQDFLEVHLEPGKYMILPRSTGVCLEFDDNKNELNSFSRDDPELISVIHDVFEKYDLINNGFLSYDELSGFYTFIGKSLTQSEYQNIIKTYKDNSFSVDSHHGISKEWFVGVFFSLIEKMKPNEVHAILEKLGYKKNLFSNRTRLFTLSLHSDIFLNVTVKDALVDNVDFEVLKILLNKFGVNINELADKNSNEVQGLFYFNK